MSDQPNNPPLRPPGAPVPGTPSPAAASSPPSGPGQPQPLRPAAPASVKPSLPGPPSSVPTFASPASARPPVPAPTLPAKPNLPAPATQAPAFHQDAASKFKLKPKVPGGPTALPAPRSPKLPAQVTPTAPAPLRAPALPPGVVLSRRAAQMQVERDLSDKKADKPENSKAFKTGLWVVVSVIALLAAGGVYLANQYFSGSTSEPAQAPAPKPVATSVPPPAAAVAPAAPVAAKPVEPPAAAPAPQSMVGRTIQQAQQSAAANDQRISAMSEVLDQSAAPAVATQPARPAASPAPTPVEKQKPAVRRSESSDSNLSEIAPPVAPLSRPEPGAPFRAWVAAARINGVFQGEPARAMINGQLFHVGQLVDGKLGIVLRGVDSDKKCLIFEDATGASMPRRY